MFSKMRAEFSHVMQGMFPLKAFYWGQRGARDNYSLQIKNIIDKAHKSLGDVPILIGECGIPMDMKYVLLECAGQLSSLLLATRRHLRRKTGHGNAG